MSDGTDYFDDYADSVARDKKAANPELKVSEKVRELAFTLSIHMPKTVDGAAALIQSSLSELLEAGRDITNLMVAQDFDLMNMTDAIMKFAAILSKWEPR